jgi:hypothetical protein
LCFRVYLLLAIQLLIRRGQCLPLDLALNSEKPPESLAARGALDQQTSPGHETGNMPRSKRETC